MTQSPSYTSIATYFLLPFSLLSFIFMQLKETIFYEGLSSPVTNCLVLRRRCLTLLLRLAAGVPAGVSSSTSEALAPELASPLSELPSSLVPVSPSSRWSPGANSIK